METNLNAELVKMQEELDLLDIAVKHIDKAKQLSTVVIQAVKGVPPRIEKHLNEVAEKYTDFLENSKNFTEETIKELNKTHSNMLDEAKQTIEDYKRIATDTEEKSTKNLKQAIDSYIAFVSKTSTETNERFESMQTAHGEQIDAAKNMLGDYRKIAEESDARSREILDKGLSEYNNYLEKSREDAKEKLQWLVDNHKEHINKTQLMIEELTQSHHNEVDEMHKVIESYEEAGKRSEKRNEEQLDSGLKQYKDYLNKALEFHKKAIDDISIIHKDEVKAVEQFTAEFIELSGINKHLLEKIENIDFPERLKSIDNNIKSWQEKNEIQNAKITEDSELQYKTISAKIDAQDKQIETQKIMLIALLVLALASVAIGIFL